MYGTVKATDDAERTAFRLAEKKYKLYYDNHLKSSKKKKVPKQVDLSEVLDFKSILQHSFDQSGELPSGIVAINCDFYCPVFGLESYPGFYFIPGALTVDEQCQWIRESLTSFPQPPNRTNHNAIYGPIHNLFHAASQAKSFVEVECSSTTLDSEHGSSVSDKDTSRWKVLEEVGIFSAEKTVLASHLLRKLRWSTLGLQFDWSKRNYNVALPHQKIPDELRQLAKRMAAPAMPVGEEFKPEAAIVNYFASGDTLGGHLDDMEADWSKPIVSMSLGCKAIFLLGGKSRQEPPLAMFLRSGDIVLMSGQARECFHGVPRIFANEENAEIIPLELQFSSEDDACFLEYIRTSRININIRQVF